MTPIVLLILAIVLLIAFDLDFYRSAANEPGLDDEGEKTTARHHRSPYPAPHAASEPPPSHEA